MKKSIGIVSFEALGAIYLACNEAGVLEGHPSQAKAILHFESMYGRAFNRGLEGVGGAMLHFMDFQIRCHRIAQEDLQSLMPDVVLPEATIQRLFGNAGTMMGVRCEGPKAREFHNGGVAPQLVRAV